MKNNFKYFGIYNEIDFKNKSENEQKELLIKSKIYIVGISTEEFNKNEFDYVIQDDPTNYVTYLGKDFELKNKIYTLNDEFLEEIFTNIMQEFQVNTPQFIEAQLKRIKLNLETYRNEQEQTSYVNEVRQSAETEYRASLNSLLFAELHANKNPVDYILKKHLKNNFYQLSNYLFGTGKLEHFTIYNMLFQFEQIKSVLKFCSTFNLEEKKDSSIKKIDLSFQLALLEKIMKLENWDDISANKKGLILTNLLGKNKDNIKDYYNESIKKVTDVSSKFYDPLGKYETDKTKASKLLKEILG